MTKLSWAWTWSFSKKTNGGGVVWEVKVLWSKNWFGVEQSREILQLSESEEFMTFRTFLVLVLDNLEVFWGVTKPSEPWLMVIVSWAWTFCFSKKTNGGGVVWVVKLFLAKWTLSWAGIAVSGEVKLCALKQPFLWDLDNLLFCLGIEEWSTERPTSWLGTTSSWRLSWIFLKIPTGGGV